MSQESLRLDSNIGANELMHSKKDDAIAGIKSMLNDAMTQIGETKEKQDLYLVQELKQFRLIN